MAETKTQGYNITDRHRRRIDQIALCFGKLIRMFLYQNDWKVIPMAMLIAAVVSMVVKNDFFVNMEGTLKGALALSCIGIWNGCFNSIQVICRERDIVKREHRAGMHISSYIISHMLYQLILCILQTIATMGILVVIGIKFPVTGAVSDYLVVDMGVTLLLITYAADMMALFISAIVRNTTTAMTVMPFLLIVQLIFSGGIFTLPSWSDGIAKFTVSHYGLRCIAAQADFNELPSVTAWNTLQKMKEADIPVTLTKGQIAITFQNDSLTPIRELRSLDVPIKNVDIKVGEVADSVIDAFNLRENQDQITFSFTIKDMIDLVGEDAVGTYVKEKTSATLRRPYYEKSRENVYRYWGALILFSMVCAILATVSLEFIDKDKR
ncbi:MAG: ABC transporter permease [Spirochaetales bacterium]|nr:ABC transporter permease [Spirochaetales bacterium]